MLSFKRIAVALTLSGIFMHSASAETTNQDIVEFIECKKMTQDYYNWEDVFGDLEKNGWKHQKTDGAYYNKKPISVYGYKTHKIELISGGVVAILPFDKTKELVTKFQVKQDPFYAKNKNFLGAKIVTIDPATATFEKSYREMILHESDKSYETNLRVLIGCKYYNETERKEMENNIAILRNE